MKIFISELKKLADFKSLWIFLAVCFAFNCLLIVTDSSYYSYADFISEFAKKHGTVINGDFINGLNQAQPDEVKEYYRTCLQSDVSTASDPYSSYDTQYIAEGYIRNYNLKGETADQMRKKYGQLQESVTALAENGGAMTVFCASQTSSAHGFIFSSLLKNLTLESCLAAVLLAILSVSGERTARTESLVYSSKIGRKLHIYKLFAALSSSVAVYALLTAATLTVFILFTPYPGVMNSNVSSLFNYINDIDVGIRPFITWSSMTVWQYMLASLCISALITAGFALFSFALTLVSKSSYISFAIFILLNFASLLLPGIVPLGSRLFFLTNMSPMCLWLSQGVWFTDGGPMYLYAHFETAGTLLMLAVGAVAVIASLIFAKRRDILCER